VFKDINGLLLENTSMISIYDAVSWSSSCTEHISRKWVLCLLVFGVTAPSGPGPPHSRGL